ncbi:SIMPL domain-containing protein [Congregibacter variabilis]|uniref:SIMPL domain-containing protein n=1 Tax=Congregibacter variabilis TaxID=3081200 RepID=A0ABZ0I3K1_9GAMM|nr:SIMPL domain-containing protein [Congregibacter sp. IMCC43200]
MQTARSFFITAFTAVLFLALATPLTGFADDYQRRIEVMGKSEIRVAPDMAMLQLDVVTEDQNAAVARREADAITAKALKVLREAGLADADIDTTGLSIAPQYRWLKDERTQQLTGYRVSRNISVRLLELDSLGELVTSLSDTGINRMQAPHLGLQDEESVYRGVLAAAAENARERASVIASSLGEELGPVMSASTQRESTPRPMLVERAMMAADSAAASSGESYSAGYLSYAVSIHATFALK